PFKISKLVTNIMSFNELAAKAGIVEDVINSQNPSPATLIVKYPTQSVNLGNELTPTETAGKPVVSWDEESDSFYTLIMTDPDAPSRANPIRGEWRHWIVTNIRGNNLESGSTLWEYQGPGPMPDTGLHRYTYLLYKQPSVGPMAMEAPPADEIKPRMKFKVREFAERYGLHLVAGNFMFAQNETTK
ncbi:Phosphatidylethanolamine-binding protein 1, partial [Nowakowskiella sp. JEL0078]